MIGVLLDVAPPLLVYYGLRALGNSDFVALFSATVAAGLKVGWEAVRARRLDPFAAYLMLSFGLSLTVGLIATDARLLMAGNALVGGVGALMFLGSCAVGRPLTEVVVSRQDPVDSGAAGVPAARRRLHVWLSAMWGLGFLGGMFLSLAIIFSMSVDLAKGVDTVASLAIIGVLLVVSVLIVTRAEARWRAGPA